MHTTLPLTPGDYLISFLDNRIGSCSDARPVVLHVVSGRDLVYRIYQHTCKRLHNRQVDVTLALDGDHLIGAVVAGYHIVGRFTAEGIRVP